MQNDDLQPDGVAAYLETAAVALREAVHAAFDDPGQIVELRNAVGDLTLIVERLPQLVRHLVHRSEHLADLEGLVADNTIDESGRDCALAVAVALESVASEIAEVDAEDDSPLAGAHRRLGALTLKAGER